MKISVLTANVGWHFLDLARAAQRWFPHVKLHSQSLADIGAWILRGRQGTTLEADRFLVRTMPAGSLEQVVFRMDVSVILPIPQPSLGRDSQNGMFKPVDHLRIDFVCNGAQMHDGCVQPLLRDVPGRQTACNAVYLLMSAGGCVNILECGGRRRRSRRRLG